MARVGRVMMTSVWGIPHVGGISTHVLTVIAELRRRGVDVDLVTPSQANGHMLDRLPVIDPLDVFRNQMRILRYLLANRLKALSKQQCFNQTPVIIHCHDAMAALAADAAVGDVRNSGVVVGNVSIVLTVHGYLAAEWVAAHSDQAGSAVHRYLLSLEKRAYRLPQSIIAVDKRLHDHVLEIDGRVPYMMENFLDTNEYTDIYKLHLDRLSGESGCPTKDSVNDDHYTGKVLIPTGRPVVLCARRLTAKNGVRVAVSAMKLVRDRFRCRAEAPFPVPVLVIAGDGEQRPLIEADIRQMGLESDVVMLGAVDGEMMRNLLRQADLAVVPSVRVEGVEEATSLAALEAMAAGVALIASSIGGLRQLVRHSETGWLVPDGNPDALAAAIETLMGDCNLRRTLVINARKSVDADHSVIKAVDRILDIYENAIEKKKELVRPDYTPYSKNAVRSGLAGAVGSMPPPKHMLRIVMLAAHNRLTGGARIFFEHANRLFRAGHDVWILAPCSAPSWFTIEMPWVQVDGLDLVGTAQASAEVVERVQRLAEPADVAVAMFWTQYKALLALPVTTKLLLEQGDPTFFEPAFQPDWMLQPMQEAYRTIPHIVTVSSVLTKQLNEWSSLHVMTIPNAVDRSVFVPLQTCRYPSEPYHVLVVGDDLAAFKGIGDILTAVDLLRKDGLTVKVTQVSPSGYRFFPGDRVILPHPSQDRIVKAYQESDVYVCGSWYEAFALPPLEAMACGTPVVTTDNGGVREYAIDGVNCLLVPPRDPQAMAEAIRLVLLNRDLWSRLRDEGLKTAERFNWERASASFEEALRTAWAMDHRFGMVTDYGGKDGVSLSHLSAQGTQARIEIASRCLIARFGQESAAPSLSAFQQEVAKWYHVIDRDHPGRDGAEDRLLSRTSLDEKAGGQGIDPEWARTGLDRLHEWAGMLVSGGKPRLAAGLMQVVLRFYPHDPDTWANLGLALLESQQPTASLVALREAAKRLEAPDEHSSVKTGHATEQKRALVYLYQGIALLQLGRSTEASQLLEQVAGGTGEIARTAEEILSSRFGRVTDAASAPAGIDAPS